MLLCSESVASRRLQHAGAVGGDEFASSLRRSALMIGAGGPASDVWRLSACATAKLRR